MSRKALLIGINYTNPIAIRGVSLGGCINDTQLAARALAGLGFTSSDVTILTDETQPLPTKQVIISELKKLLSDARSGDIRYIHYSGHGIQVPSRDGGRIHEALCPIDLQRDPSVGFSNFLSDDELHDLLVVPPGVNMTVALDCCHSGVSQEVASRDVAVANVMLTPRMIFNPQLVKYTPHGVPKVVARSAMTDLASLASFSERPIYVAGCRQDQTSADTSFEGQGYGACSYFLYNTLLRDLSISYDCLANSAFKALAEAHFPQTPQMAVPKEMRTRSYLSPLPSTVLARTLLDLPADGSWGIITVGNGSRDISSGRPGFVSGTSVTPLQWKHNPQLHTLLSDLYTCGGAQGVAAVGRYLNDPTILQLGPKLDSLKSADRGIVTDILKVGGPMLVDLTTKLIGNRDATQQRGIFGTILKVVGPAALEVVSKLTGDRELEAVAPLIPNEPTQRYKWAEIMSKGGIPAVKEAQRFIASSGSRDPEAQRNILTDIVSTVAPAAVQVISSLVGNRELEEATSQMASIPPTETNRKILTLFTKGAGLPGMKLGARLIQASSSPDEQSEVLGDVVRVMGGRGLQIAGEASGNKQLEAAGALLNQKGLDGNQRGWVSDIVKYTAGQPQVLHMISRLVAAEGAADRGIFGDILKTTGPVVLELAGKLIGNRELSEVASTMRTLRITEQKLGDWGNLLSLGGTELVKKTIQLTGDHPLSSTMRRGLWGDILKVGGSAALELAGKVIGDREISVVAATLPETLNANQRGILGDIFSIAGPAALGVAAAVIGNREINARDALQELAMSNKGKAAAEVIQREIIDKRSAWEGVSEKRVIIPTMAPGGFREQEEGKLSPFLSPRKGNESRDSSPFMQRYLYT